MTGSEAKITTDPIGDLNKSQDFKTGTISLINALVGILF